MGFRKANGYSLGGRKAGRQAGRQTGWQAGRQAGRQADRQTDRQTDRQAANQTYRQTDRQTDSAITHYALWAYRNRNNMMRIIGVASVISRHCIYRKSMLYWMEVAMVPNVLSTSLTSCC